MKEVLNMKKELLVTMAGVALFGIGFVGGMKLQEKQMNEQMANEQTENYQVLENDNVKFEYWALDNGDFDVLVTAKGDNNLLPVFNMNDTDFLRDGYFVGMQKDRAEKHVKEVNEVYNMDWTFKWDTNK